MDKREALQIAETRAEQYRRMPYDSLVDRLLGTQETFETAASSGTRYQVEVQAFWDSGKPGNLRVMVNVDAGGLGAFLPLTVDFIMAPDGSFIGA